VRGVAREVAPHSSFRFVCYCTNCQAFARFLERPDVLDDAGGTDIVHMPAACVTLTAGAASDRLPMPPPDFAEACWAGWPTFPRRR
jgi:hypothetical protein